MKIVIQRVQEASVTIDNQLHSKIGNGLLLLVGVHQDDTPDMLQKAAQKIAKMRIFSDDDQKMNLSVKDVAGEILSVSQFTLLANTKKGNRPHFQEAMAPKQAEAFYDQFNALLREENLTVKEGQFGADMAVASVNDGPVTIVYEL
ncbi:D-aminoacyl-tRNA deacylase [Holzapfeliella sp. JNUCC 72]